MELGSIYFNTATILNWKSLLKPDKYKECIINSLRFLVAEKKIMVYGFVIMPNHLHLIWEFTQLNGKELPKTRKYQFWQRDALPIRLYSPTIIFQKLDYMHNNPVQGKWLLAESPLGYKYSSASF